MAEPKLVVKVITKPSRGDDGYVKSHVEGAGFRFNEVICQTEAEVVAACKEADAILAQGPRLSRSVVQQLDKCRAIVQCSVGVDAVDVDACTEAGIIVGNLAEFCSLEVRNHAIALLLAVNRKLLIGDRLVRGGSWNPRDLYPCQNVYGQTLGLIAFGRIPRLITPVAQALGLNVITYDPYVDVAVAAEYRVGWVGLEELLRTADYVSCHVPLGPETRHFLKEEHFRMMKPTAYFVNTSRGAVVDEAALIKALKEGWIAGAGLDVLEKEPPDKDNPLFAMENVVLTPHSAGGGSGAVTMERAWRQATEEALSILNGDWPRWFVNPQVKGRARQRELAMGRA